MKLVMTLLVRNEAEVIEANLDYHLAQGVDHVIVTDHGSSDETLELLRPYERAGVATILREGGDEHHQSVRVTRMARLALSEHSADWVINNDGDEFWWPLVGSLRDLFEAIPPAFGYLEVERNNFLPRGEGEGPFYSRLVYRERRSLTPFDEPLQSKVAHRAHPEIVLRPGNHSLSGAELRPVPIRGLLEIFHYPMRDYEQFERKVIQIGTGYEKLPARSDGVGGDQLHLLTMYRSGTLRDYYDSACPNDATLEQRLVEGSVIRDTRLKQFMEGRAHGSPGSTRRPDGEAARTLIGAALRGILQTEALRVESDCAHQEVHELRQAWDSYHPRLRAALRLTRGAARGAAAAARTGWDVLSELRPSGPPPSGRATLAQPSPNGHGPVGASQDHEPPARAEAPAAHDLPASQLQAAADGRLTHARAAG